MVPCPIKDHGLQLDAQTGKVVGFFDDKTQLDTFAKTALAANIPRSAISSLDGRDSIQLLEWLKRQKFFFRDGEDDEISRVIGTDHCGRWEEFSGVPSLRRFVTKPSQNRFQTIAKTPKIWKSWKAERKVLS